jgi:hypothetical protein
MSLTLLKEECNFIMLVIIMSHVIGDTILHPSKIDLRLANRVATYLYI